MDVGFVGLGHMGSAIAANLIRRGHQLRVWNRSPGPARELAALGANVLSHPADAVQGEVLMTMLADDAAVRAVLDDGLLAGARRGLVHINLATVSVALARELERDHRPCEKVQLGQRYELDAKFGTAQCPVVWNSCGEAWDHRHD